MTTPSMAEAPRMLPDRRAAFTADRLLTATRAALLALPKEQQLEPISVTEFLARYARRLHGYDRAAADASLRAALKLLGNPRTPVSAGSLARRIDLARRPAALGRMSGGGR